MAKVQESEQIIETADEVSFIVRGLMPESSHKDHKVSVAMTSCGEFIEAELTTDEALAVGHALIEGARQAAEFQRLHSYEVIDMLKAHALCIKGAVGAIDIVYKGESVRGSPGFAYYDLEYYSDFGEGDDRDLLVKIEDYEFFFSPDESNWFRQISGLLGGNHQFTKTIQVNTKGFNHQLVINRLEESSRILRNEILANLSEEDKAELNIS